MGEFFLEKFSLDFSEVEGGFLIFEVHSPNLERREGEEIIAEFHFSKIDHQHFYYFLCSFLGPISTIVIAVKQFFASRNP